MAVKKVTAVIKLQCPAGSATPAPPIGPALGPHGVSAPKFVQEFNDRTKSMEKGLLAVPFSSFAERLCWFGYNKLERRNQRLGSFDPDRCRLGVVHPLFYCRTVSGGRPVHATDAGQ